MAHIGRSVKNVEAPRPLKSQSRSSLKNNFMLIEELIQLIENVAISLQSGINNTEPMATLVQNLRIHGPQLETVSKDTLDRAFVVFRNASQDERLNIMTRLNLLELIELRAKGWEDTGINSYYKTKQATNAELNDVQNHVVDPTQTAFLSTSPTFGGVNAGGNAAAAAVAAAIASVGSANQQHLLLSPGEVIRNSGKFPKPTKIPGKTYCKDEVVIRNADSGKVMGIKGRRVHMIEELSETIISFQRVNPGAKERLVQITGPAEDKINYAKQLIEDTIRRNASPVRLDPAMGSGHAGGSCSSLASSNSDEPVQPRTPGASSNLSNRLSFNSAQNFMTAAAASQQMVQHQPHQQHMPNIPGMNTSTPVANAVVAAAAAGKPIRPHSQMLLHSYSTNDASLGEYKFTCNVGQHVIKITGDCCDLVRVAKLVLDDYFSSAEFLASIEAGAAFDGSMASPISTPTTPMSGAPQFAMGTPLHAASPLATDSGIGLNYMASVGGNNQDIDDDVFVDGNNLSKSASQSNGLARSRRSHFSRKDSTPEAAANNLATTAIMRQKSEPGGNSDNNTITETSRIVHQYEHLLYYAKSPHSWALPTEWEKIRKQFPAIIRNKVKTTSATTHASTTATTPSTLTTTPSYSSTNTTTKASSLTLRVACNNAALMTTNITTSTPTATNTITSCTATNATTSSCLIKTLDSNLTNFTHNSTIPSPSTLTTSVTNNISVNNNNNSLSNNYNNHHQQYHQQQQQQYPNNNQIYNESSHVNGKSLETSSTSTSTAYKLNSHANLSLNIRRKGFFNRLTYSIDEDGYEAAMKTPSPIVEVPPSAPPQIQSNLVPTNHHIHASHTHNVSNVTAGSGRIHSAGLHSRHSMRSGPMTSMAISPLSSMGNGGSGGGSDHYYHHHHQHHHHHHSPNEAHTRQNLLNKQIKIISDIMVESSKSSATNKSNENLKSNYDYQQQHKINQDIDNVAADDDDDDDVEIVAISPATTTPQVANADSTNATGSNSSYMRPKLNYEFRSYSTCD